MWHHLLKSHMVIDNEEIKAWKMVTSLKNLQWEEMTYIQMIIWPKTSSLSHETQASGIFLDLSLYLIANVIVGESTSSSVSRLESWNWHYFCWKSVEFVFIVRRRKGQGILEGPWFQGTLPQHAFNFKVHGPCTLKSYCVIFKS